MDINTVDNGRIAVIKTSAQFILKVNEQFYGPFPNTEKSVMRVLNLLKTTK